MAVGRKVVSVMDGDIKINKIIHSLRRALSSLGQSAIG
jgi:hypothetical protein